MRPVIAAIAVLVAVWVWPLPSLGLPPFTTHMTMHMAVVAVAAPLLALGVAGSAWDPTRRWAFASAAIPASLLELIAVWAWHTPALHHAARHHAWALVAEQASFLLAGVWLWIAVVGGTPAERRARAASGVTALLLTSMHMTLLGALLVLTPRALFDHGHAHGWITPAQDQHLGGAVMLLLGGVVYLGGGLALTAQSLREPVAP